MQPTIPDPNKPYAYISGPLSAMSEDLRSKLRAFYEEIGSCCYDASLPAYVPHLLSDPTKNAGLSPRKVYDMDRRAVVGSRLLVAYVGITSLGVGAEIEMACQRNIPVVLVYEQDLPPDRRVSRLTRGSPNVVKELLFPEGQPMTVLPQLSDFLVRFMHDLR